MKKKLLATLLSLFMILSAFTTNVFAEETSHDFEYTVVDDGRTIEISCKNTDCQYEFYRIHGKLTLVNNNGVVSTNIDGNLHLKDVFSSEQLNSIEYYQGEVKLEQAPTVAGEYVAKITLGNATASLNYTIYAAEIGDTEYKTLADAINAIQGNEETIITMLNDVSFDSFNAEGGITAAVVIPSTKKIVIDLNGKTISGLSSASASAYLFHNKGYLTIIDSEENGKITFKSNGPDNSYNYGTSTILNRGMLTIKSGTIENTTTGGASYAVDNQTLWYDDIIPVVFNLEGGNVVCTTGDASIRQGAGLGTKYTKGGEIVKNNINITDGTVTGDIWIQNSSASYTDLNVSSGTITGKVYTTCSDYSNMNVTISGGKINQLGRSDATEAFMSGIVTGGLYTNKPLNGFVAEGYQCVENKDNATKETYPWMIGKKEVAKIGNTIYASLAKAIAAAPSDGTETTITMIADETIEGNAGVTIPSNKNIVLDLNGHIVTNLVTDNKASQVINNYGTLTIKDSTDTKLDGTGSGLLKNDVKEGTQAGDWWSTPQANYATNVIENNGTLTILSGKLENTASGSICYCVDNNSADDTHPICYIKGGLLINSNEGSESAVVRVAPTNTNESKLYMSSGTIEGKYGISFNGNSKTAPKVTIEITGGEVKAETYAFYESACGNITDTDNANVSISGGLFGIASTSTEPLIYCNEIKNFIFGGWFTKAVDTKHVYTGYIPSGDLKDCGAPNDTNVYTVVKDVPVNDLKDKEEKHLIEDGRNINTYIGTSVNTDPTLSVEDTNKIKNITVSNLNNAIDSNEKNYTVYEAINSFEGNGDVVINIQMNVDISTVDAVKSLTEKIVEEKGNVCDINNDVEFIDISINKITTAGGKVIEAALIKTTEAYQLIAFPLKDILGNDVDPEKVFIYRNHVSNDGTETNTLFTKVEPSYGPNYDGECYWIDGTNLIIKAKNFSVYGIGKQDTTIPAEQSPSPSPTPTSRYKIPNTGVEGTITNNYSLLKLSSLSLLAIGTYIVIKKKKED